MAAQTSLARQLELLKVPQTSAHKETHGSASFLYDFLEAKSIDEDTHYSVAIVGLEGLIRIDPYVEKFKENLFHETSKKFDRGVESKEHNERINELIEEYLFRVVSKYFQLSDTHKTIEWLIYRYQVHSYNVDALLGSVLPYHETRQFVRLLQTVAKVKNPHQTRWYWLKGVQESGVPLAKAILLKHCATDNQFARFVIDTIFLALQIDPNNCIFPSFLVSFSVNLMERSTKLDTVNTIMFALSKAVSMKNKALFSASYMILAHLCSVIQLDPLVLNKLLRSFARRMKLDNGLEEALIAFNIVCHTQQMHSLPVEFVNEEFVENLLEFEKNNTHCLTSLIKCLLPALVNTANSSSIDEDTLQKYKHCTQLLLNNPKSVRECMIYSLLSTIDEHVQDESSSIDEQTDHLQTNNDFNRFVVGLVSRHYPSWFDSALCALPSANKIASLLNNVRYSVVEGDKLPLFRGLQHSSKRIRRHAYLHFAKNISTFLREDDQTNSLYLRHVIKSKLLEDLDIANADILLEVFSIKENIFKLFTPQEFEQIAFQVLLMCEQVLSECNDDDDDANMENESIKWRQLKQLLLKTYCSKRFEEYNNTTTESNKPLTVLQCLFFCGQQQQQRILLGNYLLVSKFDQINSVHTILQSTLAQSIPLLDLIRSDTAHLLLTASSLSPSSSTNATSTSLFNELSDKIFANLVQYCLDNLSVILCKSNYNNLYASIQQPQSGPSKRASILLLYLMTRVYNNSITLISASERDSLAQCILSLLTVQLTCLKLHASSSINIKDLEQDQHSGLKKFLAKLGPLECDSMSLFTVSYTLYSLIVGIEPKRTSNQLSDTTEWQLVSRENETVANKVYELLMHYCAPATEQNKSVSKKVINSFRSLSELLVKKFINPDQSSPDVKNEFAFNFFIPFIANTANITCRWQTLSLLQSLLHSPETQPHLVASFQANIQHLASCMLPLSSSHLTCRQLVLDNLKSIHYHIDRKSDLGQTLKHIIDDEEKILTNEFHICQLFAAKCATEASNGKLWHQLEQYILGLLTGSESQTLTIHLRVSLLKLFTFSNAPIKSAIFKYYLHKFSEHFQSKSCKNSKSFTPDDELELSSLIMLISDRDESIFQVGQELICQFYLRLIEATEKQLSENLSLQVYNVLSRRMFDRVIKQNVTFALEILSTMLRVQLSLSEMSSSSSTVSRNLALMDSLRKQLRRITYDGDFIVQALQHLLSIEDIHDSLANEPITQKRIRIEGNNFDKFTTGWKLIRLYVDLFQSKDKLINTESLVKSLFEYLKLTFIDDNSIGDNSKEYTRLTLLLAIANCIELRLTKRSQALEMEKRKNYIDMDNEESTASHVVVPMDTDQIGDELTTFLSVIDVDYLVDCMRESRLKETQKIALLAISLVAPYFQKKILDYLVAIFTFIGTNLLQCDDQYSLTILFETMESIVPIILAENDQPDAAVEERDSMKQYIISIFVKSFSDIPSYRRLPLFTKLIQLLDENRFLSIVTVRLLEETCLLKNKITPTERAVWNSFLSALFSQFSPQTQFTALCTLLRLFEHNYFNNHLKRKLLQKQLIQAQTDQQEASPDKVSDHEQLGTMTTVADLKVLTDSLSKQFVTKMAYDSDKLACGLEILKFITTVISEPELVDSTLPLATGPLSISLTYFLNLLLELIVTLGPSDPSLKVSLNMYRRRIKMAFDEMLLKYNALLPHEKLVDIVINELFAQSALLEPALGNLIKRKALELLSEKLIKLAPNDLKSRFALKMLISLDKQLPKKANKINKLDELQIHNVQLIMLSLKLGTKFMVAKEEDSVSTKAAHCLSEVLTHVSQLAKAIVVSRNAETEELSPRSKLMQNLKGSCVLCLTQLISVMSLAGIEFLSDVVNLVLDNFDVLDDMILITNVSSLSKLIVKFAQFLSPHLKAIILKLLHAYTWCERVPNLRPKLQAIWTNLAQLVPKRVIFEAIDSCYQEAVDTSPSSIIELMALFRLSCDNLEKTDVDIILRSFKNFMIKALNYRCSHQGHVSGELIESIEASFGKAFSAFIPKLTESSFRPILYRLFEWALQLENHKQVDPKDNQSYSLPPECYYRMIAFYRFCSLLVDSLKSLFCVFVAPSLINNCSEMLLAYHSANFELDDGNGQVSDFVPSEQRTSSTERSKLKLQDNNLGEPLVNAILATLSKCFLYDLNGSFVNKDCTSLIVKPIVNQISNLLGSEADYETRLELILQCTQYLIQNNKDETLFKDFNYQILLKTRESSEKVRVGALKVLHRVILTCSEDYLPFIPEAIPFIAELSEDDSDLVESHLKKLIIDIEQLVGEPINKYL